MLLIAAVPMKDWLNTTISDLAVTRAARPPLPATGCTVTALPTLVLQQISPFEKSPSTTVKRLHPLPTVGVGDGKPRRTVDVGDGNPICGVGVELGAAPPNCGVDVAVAPPVLGVGVLVANGTLVLVAPGATVLVGNGTNVNVGPGVLVDVPPPPGPVVFVGTAVLVGHPGQGVAVGGTPVFVNGADAVP